MISCLVIQVEQYTGKEEIDVNKLLQTAYDYIDHNQQAMISLWKNIVSIESPSSDQQAVGRIAAHLDTY